MPALCQSFQGSYFWSPLSVLPSILLRTLMCPRLCLVASHTLYVVEERAFPRLCTVDLANLLRTPCEPFRSSQGPGIF